jgi:acyl-CoA synthetase (AMP-forming)/AMP-acid ligase II
MGWRFYWKPTLDCRKIRLKISQKIRGSGGKDYRFYMEYRDGLVSEIAQKSKDMIDVICRRASEHPDRLAYVFLRDGERDERRITFGDLLVRAKAIASTLQSLGLEGERALLFYPSGIEYLEAFWGCLFANVVAVPLFPPRPNRGFSRFITILADSEAKIALTTIGVEREYKNRFYREIPLPQMIWLSTDSIKPDIQSEWNRPHITPESTAYFQYTSGSTTAPKSVMVSHRNLLKNSQCYKEYMGNEEGSIQGAWLPFYHDMGLIGYGIQGPYIGGTVYFFSPFDFLKKPIRWLRMLSNYKVHTTGAPNFAFDLCVNKTTAEQREGLDLSSVKQMYNGSESIRAGTCERFVKEFEPYGLHPHALGGAYGLAENTLVVSCCDKNKPAAILEADLDCLEQGIVREKDENTVRQTKLVSSGRMLEEYDIRIVDPTSRKQLAPGCVGEIWVSHPSVAMGYWKQEEDSERTFRARISDTQEGPFLRTGDLGAIVDGQLYLTGRLKELIIIEGRNHYPQDIELTVEQTHPAIRPTGCAAFSVERDGSEKLVVVAEIDPRWKCVNPRAGFSAVAENADRMLDIDRLIKDIRKAVSEVHDVRPQHIELLKFGQIFKTTSGKTQRQACKQAFLEGTFVSVSAEEDPSEAPDHFPQRV